MPSRSMGFIVLIAGKASAGVGLIAVTFTIPSSQASSFTAAKAFLVTRSERWATSSKCIDLNGIWKTPYSDQANFYLILKTKSYSVRIRTFLACMFFPQTGHVIFLFTDVYKLFIISPHALHSRTYVA